MSEPDLYKAGDPRVSINGLPLIRDGRFLSETLYQELKGGQILSTLHVQRSGTRLPTWLIIVAAIALVFGTLWFTGYFDRTDVKKAEQEKTAIEFKIDSTTTRQNQNREDLVNNSQGRANQSTNIKNRFKDEKIIIRDTTYSAMCDFVQSYRPE